MTKFQKTLAVIGLFLIWTVLAIGLDRYVIRDWAPWFSHLLYFRDAEIVIKPFDRTYTWLGLAVVLVLPSLIVGLAGAIYAKVKQKAPWSAALGIFGLLGFWFFAIPVLIFFGEIIYRFLKSGLDDWSWAKGIAGICEGFVFKGYLYSYKFQIIHIESGLGAIVGLFVGVALYYRFGLWSLIKKRLNAGGGKSGDSGR